MKYHVTIRGRTYEVDVAGDRVTLDGTTLEAHFAPVPATPLCHLLIGGESFTVAVDPAEAGRWALGLAGERYEVQVVDERTRQIQALTGSGRKADGGGVLLAPMPGLVVRVEVQVGQTVAAGAGLVVVEAMKMENELRAGRPGTVAAVHVTPGQAVEKGTPLVTLAESEPSS